MFPLWHIFDFFVLKRVIKTHNSNISLLYINWVPSKQVTQEIKFKCSILWCQIAICTHWLKALTAIHSESISPQSTLTVIFRENRTHRIHHHHDDAVLLTAVVDPNTNIMDSRGHHKASMDGKYESRSCFCGWSVFRRLPDTFVQ